MENINKKWKVMVSAPYLQPLVKNYQAIFAQHNIEIIAPKVNERMSEEELLGQIQDIDGIICGDDRITAKVIAQAKNLKVISKWGTGIDSIDRQAAAQKGIPVKNTPGAFTEPVADQVFNFMLNLARNTIELNEAMKNGVWKKKVGLALHECVLGIVGFGDIGHAVLKEPKLSV
jgi:D-3-phosphoglycerate dehydrogenase